MSACVLVTSLSARQSHSSLMIFGILIHRATQFDIRILVVQDSAVPHISYDCSHHRSRRMQAVHSILRDASKFVWIIFTVFVHTILAETESLLLDFAP